MVTGHHMSVTLSVRDVRLGAMVSVAEFWDTAAETYDEEPDHGLRDPRVAAAWAERLRDWLPVLPVDTVELGCGTGSLSLLAARQGHRVTGVDLSPAMAALAGAKLAGLDAHVLVGDAAEPPLADASYDVVLARHLLWTLPDPAAALRRWARLLRPGGRLVLIEGRWNATASYADETLPWLGGVGAVRLTEAIRPLAATVHTEPLTDPALWGKPIDDERYALIAQL